ncbi:C-type lectin protein [Ochromonadaceae sp. CCMP2298]|nr:C-type lectin protein [Ochromonadaceae sp. CCMP2298]
MRWIQSSLLLLLAARTFAEDASTVVDAAGTSSLLDLPAEPTDSAVLDELLTQEVTTKTTKKGNKGKKGKRGKKAQKTQKAKASTELSEMVALTGGRFWFGSQLGIGDKILAHVARDGAEKRRQVRLEAFMIDQTAVSVAQFEAFVEDTGHVTDAERYRWSFVLEGLASESVRGQVDGPGGYGRVKDAEHWMAVPGAYWAAPHGDSDSADRDEYLALPVTQVSLRDAEQFCAWAGRRLPSEEEWEYAARGGRNKQPYPWGEEFKPNQMNIWEGQFPSQNLLLDGFYGPAPVREYSPNAYGLYNMLGNVWEWVSSTGAEKAVMRGGSFVDSVDGKFNHIVLVSSKQENEGDSTASNIGFRCAKTPPPALVPIPPGGGTAETAAEDVIDLDF